MVQAHIQELRRSRPRCSAQPISTNERTAARHRDAAKTPARVARAIERFVGHPAPEAYAF
jgi:hypothetical protein